MVGCPWCFGEGGVVVCVVCVVCCVYAGVLIGVFVGGGGADIVLMICLCRCTIAGMQRIRVPGHL